MRRSRSSRNFGGRTQRGQKGNPQKSSSSNKSNINNHRLRGGTRGLGRRRSPVEGVWCNGDTDCPAGCDCMNGNCYCKGTYVTQQYGRMQ